MGPTGCRPYRPEAGKKEEGSVAATLIFPFLLLLLFSFFANDSCGKDDEKLQQGGSGMGGMAVQLRSTAIMAGLSEDGCKIVEKLQWRLIVESQQEHQRSSL
ncbi:hypothetical protein BHE74_00016271 [Ensete ventricosum]|nr:hypothetical protein BHE74_00016271 [Ensete ventricosum]